MNQGKIKIFSHENIVIIHNIRNILMNEGIRCSIKNDIVSSGVGEVPPIEVWPEIWIEKETDSERAKQIIKLAIHGDPSKSSWFCRECGEENAPAFELCWQCGHDQFQ